MQARLQASATIGHDQEEDQAFRLTGFDHHLGLRCRTTVQLIQGQVFMSILGRKGKSN